MPTERKYTGPYANVETYVLEQQVLDEPVKKPWYSVPVSEPYREAGASSALIAENAECKRRWLAEIPSRHARQIVAEAHRYAVRMCAMVSWVPGEPDYLSVGLRTADTLAYRNWVRRKLHASGLAERLPSGLAELPDIYAEMPTAWATLERLRQPRNYKQLVRHVARHLDWYLDPTQRVKPPVWVVGLIPALILAGILGFLGAQVLSDYDSIFVWWGIIGGFGLGMGATALSVERHNAFGTTLRNFHGWRHTIMAAELYYYLREAYSLRDEPCEPAQL